MEEWELDFEWLRVRHIVKEAMNREELPDLNAILFLVGIQELGRWEDSFSKEEKQDLMHIGVCSLLSEGGHYEFVGRDQDGWPHYEAVRPVEVSGVKNQERLLKEKAVEYFKRKDYESEHYRS